MMGHYARECDDLVKESPGPQGITGKRIKVTSVGQGVTKQEDESHCV